MEDLRVENHLGLNAEREDTSHDPHHLHRSRPTLLAALMESE